jgi:hypothetical protein
MLHAIIKNLDKRKPNISFNRMHNSCFSSLAVVVWVMFLVGCTTLKKALIVGSASLAGAAAGSAFSTGALVPAATGAMAASATSVIADSVMTPKGGGMSTSTSCAPDNFFTLLGDLVSIGGWFLILLFVVPMLLGWILPGPLTRKKKGDKV